MLKKYMPKFIKFNRVCDIINLKNMTENFVFQRYTTPIALCYMGERINVEGIDPLQVC